MGSNFNFTFEVLDHDMQFPENENNNEESFILDIDELDQNQINTHKSSNDERLSHGSNNKFSNKRRRSQSHRKDAQTI